MRWSWGRTRMQPWGLDLNREPCNSNSITISINLLYWPTSRTFEFQPGGCHTKDCKIGPVTYRGYNRCNNTVCRPVFVKISITTTLYKPLGLEKWIKRLWHTFVKQVEPITGPKVFHFVNAESRFLQLYY